MAYTTIDNPELYFQTKLYTGNATDDTGITLDGDENMQPDLVWIKGRSETASQRLNDAVRGAGKELLANTDGAEHEYDPNTAVKSFDADGFTLGTDNGVNKNTVTYVAWCWKAGTSFSNDASATSVGTIDSSGSASDSSGFSIVLYTGTGSSGTIKHGLSSAPTTIFIKRRNSSDSWTVGHNSNGWGGFLRLDTEQAFGSDTSTWTNTAPTSTVFAVNTNDVNNSGTTFVAYCFTEKKGFSKFSSYQGSGNSDGPYIHLGFKPAWLLIKATGSSNSWQLFDNKRDGYNPDNNRLYPDSTTSESTTDVIDLLSNGFKVRDTNTWLGSSGATFVYWAFAEAPFVNSKGVPANAR